ncbi:MAG TPA: peptidylprolyl isomerase [Xanthobacteraceae bacterium]|nr:peptidylprolyl isomerase [Xanthobacteraceae bacterium]
MSFHRPHAARPLRAALAAALLGAVAMFPAAPPALAQTAAPAAAPAAVATDDPVLATVNGAPIRRSDLTVAEEELGSSLPQQLVGPAREEYVLGFLIDMTAMAQAAQAAKLDQTPEYARAKAFSDKRLLMQAALTEATKKSLTDAALKATYEEAVKQQKPEKEVHARHILFRVEDVKDEKASAAAEQKAKDVLARLKKGEDFGTLAKELTEDPSGKQDGGDLGFFAQDQMVPEFATVAFATKPGELAGPVKTQFGWHVIKVEEVREKPVPTFDQVKPQIEQFVAQKSQADYVQSVRSQAKVEKTAAAPKPDAAEPPKAP